MDDHVSKLEHMGKETVKKLQDIHGSALQCGIELSVHTNCINKGAWQGMQGFVALSQTLRLHLLPSIFLHPTVLSSSH